ncbi:uncharacterized protein PV07_00429 [Cladophialophora immunda]|uniref:Uncharacterized protein n=1 Tax=Cladophialophora immunda TaxID=569365 RepID=A0A0D2B7N8_9EURO|nr:uncharacterized protein PV07_00429 [Cladophialophora immunda]KIW33592.1 hypothetical protein PV07_00429 [Cladophialophora immunda]
MTNDNRTSPSEVIRGRKGQLPPSAIQVDNLLYPESTLNSAALGDSMSVTQGRQFTHTKPRDIPHAGWFRPVQKPVRQQQPTALAMIFSRLARPPPGRQSVSPQAR